MAFDFVKQQAFRLGSQVLSNKIANLPGLAGLSNGGTSQSPTAAINQVYDKRSTENLSFPLDVEGDPGIGNHGHYIMFFINAQEKAKLHLSGGSMTRTGGPGPARTITRSVVEGNKQNSVPNRLKATFDIKTNGFEDKTNKDGHSKQVNDNVSSSVFNSETGDPAPTSGVKGGYKKELMEGDAGVALRRPPTRRLKTAIAMYMPPQVSATYGANYTDTEIGAGVELGLSAFNDLLAGKYASAATNIGGLDDPIRDGLIKMVLGTLGALPGLGGISEADSIKRGRLISNRMELAFKGINKRQFQYTFKMIPRSKAEADEIRKIIYAFKFNMLPEFEGGNRAGRRFTVPNTFDIQYMYTGNQNQYLHNISTCVLETMNVTYGGDRFKTFEGNSTGAPVVETNMTLNFKEMELITRERVQEGY